MAKDKTGMKKFIKNSFFYGAIGDRLLGQRTSEMYNSSAKEINNMLVTDLGTLKVMKKFNESPISLNGTLRDVLNTSDDYYIALTTTHIYLLDKTNNSVITSITHGLNSSVKLSIIKKEMVVLYDGVNIFKVYKIKNHTIVQKINIGLVLPIGDKKEIEIDLWRVRKSIVDSQLELIKIDGQKDIKFTIKNNEIFLANSTTKINRIYTTYTATLNRNDVNNPLEGEIYGFMKLFHKVDEDSKYIIGNTNVAIGTLTEDTKYKGQYFSKITSSSEVTGKFMFGSLLDVSKPEVVSYYQDRLIMGKLGYIFFSKVSDYFNFESEKNETENAFRVDVAPINSRRGKLLGLVPSNGLYVITSVGIYILGLGLRLTGSNIYTGSTIATDMNVSGEFEIVNNILYFTNNSGVLKALSLNTASQQLNYSTFTVDRYTTYNKYDYLTKMTIEDKNYLIAMRDGEDKMYLFNPVSEGIFRKTTIDYTGSKDNIHSINEKMFTDNHVYVEGDKNYSQAHILLNPPAMKGESVLCDNSSIVNSVSTKLINEDREGIKGIRLENTNIQNLGMNIEDVYSVYKVTVARPLTTGIVLDIFTNENDKNVELQSVQTVITVQEDY